MTTEEIIRFAIQAGLKDVLEKTGAEKLENFARLIEGAEKERCFDVCGQVEGPPGMMGFYEGARACADAILKSHEE